jgi:hypothetical protein
MTPNEKAVRCYRENIFCENISDHLVKIKTGKLLNAPTCKPLLNFIWQPTTKLFVARIKNIGKR